MSSKLKVKVVIPWTLLGAGKVTTRRVTASLVSSSETNSDIRSFSESWGTQGNQSPVWTLVLL